MDAETRRFADAQKNMRKSERHGKELIFNKMKIKRIMNACKHWLIKCSPRSSHTRSKLKKQRKLLLLTLQSSAKSKPMLALQLSELISMSSLQPDSRQEP